MLCGGVSRMSLASPNLLITDDDRAFRETLRCVLDRFGFQMFMANDGQEALEIVNQHRVDLALMDVHMPRLGGIETLIQVRQQGLKLPCILMSAAMDDSIRAAAAQIDDVSVMAKPMRARELSTVVTDFLSRRYGWTV